MKVCINPGHSGVCEPGACAETFREAEINMKISRIIAKLLIKRGYEVILTRNGDIENDGLSWRAEIANQAEADIFISIHCNSAGSLKANGTETWYFEDSCNGLSLARSIQRSIVTATSTTDRGVKATKALTVLNKTTCPAVLVELAFLSNPDDRIILTDVLLRRQFAVGVVDGIEAWVA